MKISMKTFDIIEHDPYLKDFEDEFNDRFNAYYNTRNAIAPDGNIANFANGYNFFGCHKSLAGWIFREWAPNATEIFLIGEHSDWKPKEEFAFKNFGDYWELHVAEKVLHKGSLYRLLMRWDGGEGERIPAYATRTVQDDVTKIFSAQIWNEVTTYEWKYPAPSKRNDHPIIYEAHIGMAQESPRVSTYREFKVNVLPRIVAGGYNTLQLMAVQEHPYYGSFGYHVSSFFAASSRFGTPEELKEIIDEAHKNNLYVIMDIVHSHAVKNEVEGLAKYDGTSYQFFHEGEKGNHPAWDSKCFNYGKHDVLNFLLSNCKYWLMEYHFDGFRFDGVTSMLYWNHGLNRNFTSYNLYFEELDLDASVYMMLANSLIHSINPNAITIAEDMSGMPGIAVPLKKGGFGFDFRLAMGVPDFWIKTIKEVQDEDWDVGTIYYELNNRRSDEDSISYVESHDQALVGDKTLSFRLMDSNMYTSMSLDSKDLVIDRGVALHKMIRLFTLATAGSGYLNFMGNEFGHPEWIDFPREGNNWSYKYCRRQWSLVDNHSLRYYKLAEFDKAMIRTVVGYDCFSEKFPCKVYEHSQHHVVAFLRNKLLFVFNFHPTNSYSDYCVDAPAGEYVIVLDTDSLDFDGFGRNDPALHHFTIYDGSRNYLKLYLPARTALCLATIQ